jgi:hypothetical protein
MAALVTIGLAVVAADVALRRPFLAAGAAGAATATWCALRARRRAQWPPELGSGPAADCSAVSAVDAVRRLWSRAPFEGRLLATLVTAIWTAVGLELLLGVAGVQLLAAAAVCGLPLLLARTRLGEFDNADGDRVESDAGPGPEASDAVCLGDASDAVCLGLSVAELLDVWRASSTALAGPLDPAQRARIAAARARYLDAMQEHDPAGVAEWLTSPHAQDRDPARFLYSRSDPSSRQ